MDSDFRAFLETPDLKPLQRRRGRGYNAFGWAICLLLLAGVVMASWIGSFYVFSHPENPDCYHFLKELNRIEPLKRFEVTAAPPGKFFTAKELYDAYLTMTPEELNEKNNDLLRNYLRNYSDTKTPVPYIWGRFTTTGVYELSKSDMFPSGMVAVADSVDFSQVQIEHVYPTAFPNIPRARQMLAMDPEINLAKTFDLSTVVHVEKLEGGRMLFTVLPLAYGQYAYREGISSTFRLDPPSSVNLEAGMPVVKAGAMENAVKNFALYRKNKGMLAKGKMLTLPPATSTSLQTTDLYTAQDIPAEAYQPLPKPAITAPAAEQPAPEDTAAASAPQVTAPMENLPPSDMPPSTVETTAQTAPEPPPAASISQPPQVATVSQPALVSPIASIPAIAKTSPPALAPEVAATAPAAPVLSRANAPVKLAKIIPKTALSTLPPSAPAVRPVARIQPGLPSAAVIAALPHPAVSKPKSTLANAPQIAARPVLAPAQAPVAVRALPLPPPAPVEYAETTPPESPSGVKLHPFLATPVPPPVQLTQEQEQPAAAPARTATWHTYRPGTMPRGKLINVYTALQLADLGVGSEPVYVQGRFVVTASSDGRAVLRPVNYSGGISGTSMRMLVEYPGGTRIPAEGTQIARGALRPFQITDVRRGDDGQVNVYAREVTDPPAEASSPYVRYYPRTVQRDGAYSD